MKHFVIYSGGMDSFTLLNELVGKFGAGYVTAITFHYGQRHKIETTFAENVCRELTCGHILVDMAPVFNAMGSKSSLVSDTPVPEGHYEAETMKATVVPARNTIMLSVAMGIAEASFKEQEILYNAQANTPKDEWKVGFPKQRYVYYGAHAGDHHIYPDCRPEYIRAMRHMFYQATEDAVRLETPYMNTTKGEILAKGLARGLDYSKSWTCYNGGTRPCGKCGACQERAEAFAQNKTIDPLLAD